MTDQEIRILWLYCQQTFANFDVPLDDRVESVKLDGWRDNLGDLPPGAVRAALVDLGGHFVPALSEVRSRACELLATADGVPMVPDIDQAWAEVMEAAHTVGRYRTPVWSHPAIATTVESLGWVEICGATELGVVRGQFARLYTSAASRARRAITPPAPVVAGFLHAATQAIAHVDHEPASLEVGPDPIVWVPTDGGRSALAQIRDKLGP